MEEGGRGGKEEGEVRSSYPISHSPRYSHLDRLPLFHSTLIYLIFFLNAPTQKHEKENEEWKNISPRYISLSYLLNMIWYNIINSLPHLPPLSAALPLLPPPPTKISSYPWSIIHPPKTSTPLHAPAKPRIVGPQGGKPLSLSSPFPVPARVTTSHIYFRKGR